MDGFDLALEIVVATDAFRSSARIQKFCKAIHKATNFQVRILSGDEEAYYIYRGVRLTGVLKDKTRLIVDIGGGSVECILATGSQIFWKHSFPLGAQRLLSLFDNTRPMSYENKQALSLYIHKCLASLWRAMDKYNADKMIGCSGTFTTLYALHAAQTHKNKKGKMIYKLPREEAHSLASELIDMSLQARLDLPGMVKSRAPMIGVSAFLVSEILNKYPFMRVRVSSYALKEGLLSTYMDKL